VLPQLLQVLIYQRDHPIQEPAQLTLHGDLLWWNQLEASDQRERSNPIARLQRLWKLCIFNIGLRRYPPVPNLIVFPNENVLPPYWPEVGIDDAKAFWVAVLKVEELRSLEIASMLWERSICRFPWELPMGPTTRVSPRGKSAFGPLTVGCNHLTHLSFEIDGSETPVHSGVSVLDLLLFNCSHLKQLKISGPFWRSRMELPRSLEELDIHPRSNKRKCYRWVISVVKDLPKLTLLRMCGSILGGDEGFRAYNLPGAISELYAGCKAIQCLEIDNWRCK
jgi:hypothetical protein